MELDAVFLQFHSILSSPPQNYDQRAVLYQKSFYKVWKDIKEALYSFQKLIVEYDYRRHS